jgi:hypothetical protein
MINSDMEIELKRPLQNIEPPYGQCDKCHYVSTEIANTRICPVCGCNHQSGYTHWPDVELIELWYDAVAMWNQQRVELSAVVAAMYFESSVFHLIFWGTVWLDPELNWIGAEFEELSDKQKRIWAFLNTIRSYEETNQSLKRVFGCDGQEMLIKVLGQDYAKFFWCEYRKLADYRNNVIHRGQRSIIRNNNQTPLISDPKAGEILDWCLKFIPACWNVFVKLHNEFIHKPMWERKQKESANA